MATEVAVSVDPYVSLPYTGPKPYVAEFASGKAHPLYIPSGRLTQPYERLCLVNLADLFVTALPNMPHAHIIRTLFSRQTQCLAIIGRGYVVRAGLAYHILPQRGFVELAFVAAREEDRAKGYAAFLMQNLRARVRLHTPKISAILAYADHSARGWFARQGFGDVTLPHERWAGYIYDYDGAQLVQTNVHAFGEEVFWRNERGEVVTVRGLPMCKLPFDAEQEQRIVRSQYDAVRMEMLKRRPDAGVVYPGLTFKPGEVKDPETIPGLAGRGQATRMHLSTQIRREERLRRLLLLLVDTMKADTASEPFLYPVDTNMAPGYHDMITQPMDLETLHTNIANGVYDPVKKGLNSFLSDARRIFDNCREYNGASSPYTLKAERLREKLEKALKKWKHIVHEIEEMRTVEAQTGRLGEI